MAFEMKVAPSLSLGRRVKGVVGADGDGLIDLGVRVGLVLALVPAEAAVGPERGGELLLEVEPTPYL